MWQGGRILYQQQQQQQHHNLDRSGSRRSRAIRGQVATPCSLRASQWEGCEPTSVRSLQQAVPREPSSSSITHAGGSSRRRSNSSITRSSSADARFRQRASSVTSRASRASAPGAAAAAATTQPTAKRAGTIQRQPGHLSSASQRGGAAAAAAGAGVLSSSSSSAKMLRPELHTRRSSAMRAMGVDDEEHAPLLHDSSAGARAVLDIETGGSSSSKGPEDGRGAAVGGGGSAAGGGGGSGSGGGGGKARNKALAPSWDLVAIALVYSVQGLLSLSRLAVSFYFKDELHIQPADAAVLTGLAASPWVVKPLYGFLSDAVPLFGYRRRSYLALCGMLGALSWLALAYSVDSVPGAVAALFMGALSTACSDVVVDSIVVERSRGEPQSTAGQLQSLCWTFQSLGGIAAAYFSGWAVQEYGTHAVFGATAVFPLLVSVSAFLIDEKRFTPSAPGSPFGAEAGGLLSAGSGGGGDGRWSSSSSSAVVLRQLGGRLKDQGVALWGAVSQKQILLPTAFVFLWQATPSADSSMFYFYTEQLHFTPEFLGRVTLASRIAMLAGVGIYNFLLKEVPLRRVLFWSAVIGTGLGMTQLILITGANRGLGLSDELFVIGDSVVLVALGQVSFMPVLVLAARMCPAGVEATLFATLMSVMNAGGFTSGFLGAGLTKGLGVTATDFSNLALLVAICNLSSLLPLPLLRLMVPGSLDRDREEGGSGGSGGSGGGSGGADGSSSALLGDVVVGSPPLPLAEKARDN